MLSHSRIFLLKFFFSPIFILYLSLFLPLSHPAFAEKMDLPLVSSDLRVIEGNAIFENALQKLEKELKTEADEYARKLRPDVQIIFDYNQMDWIVYFHIEAMAFKPADVWSRREPARDEYENLYQQNTLFALDFRVGQINAFRDRVVAAPRYDEAGKKNLLNEIKEAQYRVNVWTEERLRPRLYRAEEAWETYRAGSLKFAEVLGWDRAQITELDYQLLEYRFALLSRQREALFRLKYEAEE